jgi:hypothetical protein
MGTNKKSDCARGAKNMNPFGPRYRVVFGSMASLICTVRGDSVLCAISNRPGKPLSYQILKDSTVEG